MTKKLIQFPSEIFTSFGHSSYRLLFIWILALSACDTDSNTQSETIPKTSLKPTSNTLSKPIKKQSESTKLSETDQNVLAQNLDQSVAATKNSLTTSLKSGSPVLQLNSTDQKTEDSTSKSSEKLDSLKKKKKKKKKNQRCRRGIHKGRKKCMIERGHISLYHINRGKRKRNLRLVDENRRIIPEAREVMLDFLSDWRAKTKCKKGFSFNFKYKGRASWRMYDCYVQDRLLWYLYLIGHHFDSEIHIVSGLRSHERKTSRHHNGHAVDFKVPGVSAKKVWEYAKKTFPLVGIGYYPKTRFVHLDVGRDDHQAYWVDSSGSGESASYKSGVSQVQRGRARKSQAGMIRSIKRSLKRHYKSFKSQQKGYIQRQKNRAARAKRRKKKRAAQAKRRKRNRRRKR